jgi:hypothetical protein
LLESLISLRQILPQTEYDKFLNTPVPDPSRDGVAELVREIRGISRRKFNPLSGRFERFLQSVLRFSPVIDVLISSNPKVTALIWGSAKFVIMVKMPVSRGVSKNYQLM